MVLNPDHGPEFALVPYIQPRQRDDLAAFNRVCPVPLSGFLEDAAHVVVATLRKRGQIQFLSFTRLVVS